MSGTLFKMRPYIFSAARMSKTDLKFRDRFSSSLFLSYLGLALFLLDLANNVIYDFSPHFLTSAQHKSIWKEKKEGGKKERKEGNARRPFLWLGVSLPFLPRTRNLTTKHVAKT